MADLKESIARARVKLDRVATGLCSSCGETLARRVSTVKRPFRYHTAGREIPLVGLSVHACTACGQETADIPRLDGLHAVIASIIVESAKPLTGQEIRFLRRMAGIAAKDFASLLGVSPEHLSRVENEHTTSLGLATDRLARAIFLASQSRELESLKGALLDPLLGRGEADTDSTPAERVCSFAGQEWHHAA